MRPLPDSDRRHFEAAQGWLVLGSFLEADAELDKITPEFRVHPYVLGLRWSAYFRAKRWDAAFEIARFLTEQLPDDPFGWLNRFIVARNLGSGRSHGRCPNQRTVRTVHGTFGPRNQMTFA